MIITLQTTNEQLLKVFNEEMEGAQRWLNKKTMSRQGGNAMIALGEKVRRTKKSAISELIDYQPKSGNKWKVCYKVEYYNGEIVIVPCLLMYYETIGSIGIFAPLNIGYSIEKAQGGVIIFTSHFFHRYFNPERDKAANVSLEDAISFVCDNLTSMVNETKDKYGNATLDMRVKGGIARGYQRQGFSDGSPVFEIRTFLKDEQLSICQQRATKHLRKASDKHQYIPIEVAENVIKNSSDPSMVAEDYLTSALASYGINEAISRSIIQCCAMVNEFVYACSDDIPENGWSKVSELCKKYCNDVADYVITSENLATYNDVIRIAFQASRKYGFHFDVLGAEQRTLKYYGSLDKPIADKTGVLGIPMYKMTKQDSVIPVVSHGKPQ